MRLGWLANYSSNSGYALQSRLFVPRIKSVGHEIQVLNIAGGTHVPQLIGGVEVLPTFHDALGRDSAQVYYHRHKWHALISLIDTWAYIGMNFSRMNWYPHTPIDHQPAPPDVVTALKDAKRPIAMSRFGERMLRQAGFDPLYIPLAYDPNVWKPGSRTAARRELRWADDWFVVTFAGVNDSCPSRKGIFELLAAWQMFSENKPDVYLYLHTSTRGNLAKGKHSGVNIPELITMMGINPASIIWVDQDEYRIGIPSSHLVAVAHASNVLCAPSRGEGFGLIPLEFQAAGCPVITTDFSAQTELNFGGWLVEYEPELSWQGSLWAKPGILSIVERLEEAYNERNDNSRSRVAADEARAYSVDRVMQTHMLPTLRTITEMVLEAV